MGALDRFGADVVVAFVVAAWFIASGVADMVWRPPSGRRAVTATPGGRVSGRIRGALEIFGGFAAAAGGVISLLGLRLPFPGLAVNVALAGLAAWAVADSVRGPVRIVRLVVAVLGFALAVFSAGFRD